MRNARGRVGALGGRRRGGLEGLLEIGDDVVDVFRADGNTDQVLADAGSLLLLVAELLVGGGPGAAGWLAKLPVFSGLSSTRGSVHLLDGQGLGVADVGQVRDQLEAVNDLAAGGTAALDAEGQDAAEAALEVLLGGLVVGVALEAGIGDPADVVAVLEVLGEGESVLGVALGAQGEGLDAEEQLLGGEGAEAGAEVAQDLDAGADDVGDGAEGVPELEAVVSVGGLVELGEAGGVLAPVELARVDDDTADGGAVAADPLRGGVDDDVGAVLDGADEVAASTEGVVHDEGHALGVGDLGDGGEIGDVVLGVADGLDVDGLGLLIDGGVNVLDAVAVDELGVDAEAGEEDLELVVGAAVEEGGRDNVVAGVSEGVDGDELSGLAGGGGQSGDTTLEGGNALLEDVDSGLAGVSEGLSPGRAVGLTFMMRE